MGVYLSTASTEKDSEDGTVGTFAFGVSAMQGWRRTMEDAHVVTRLPNAGAILVGVFDGHGGDEVAHFCKERLPGIVDTADTPPEGWPQKLHAAFLQLDALLALPEVGKALRTDSQRRSARLHEAAPGEDEDGGRSSDHAAEILRRVLDLNRKRAGVGAGQPSGESLPAPAPGSAGAVARENAPAAAPGAAPAAAAAMCARPLDAPPNGRPPPLDSPRSPESPDLPVVQSGCTAIVAVIHQGQLHVANAGDSRAVLCRAGEALELSKDHKPTQEAELLRIQQAGGWVTEAGRVNGNLNLSRSVGDLRYKQNTALAPEDQVITAAPDVRTMEMSPDDEFLVIACDGVWDCKTSSEVVHFVRDRLAAQPRAPLSAIVEALLDDCVSADPRQTGGIGGDNMTCVILQLSDAT